MSTLRVNSIQEADGTAFVFGKIAQIVNATTQTENFTTHSFFAPYVTTIGLYNDHGDLLAVAKTSRPVRNDPEIALSFIVRFDI